jgi:hypothetical protein
VAGVGAVAVVVVEGVLVVVPEVVVVVATRKETPGLHAVLPARKLHCSGILLCSVNKWSRLQPFIKLGEKDR